MNVLEIDNRTSHFGLGVPRVCHFKNIQVLFYNCNVQLIFYPSIIVHFSNNKNIWSMLPPILFRNLMSTYCMRQLE